MRQKLTLSLLCLLGLLITSCAAEKGNWPNLASVPPRPKEFSTSEERAALRARLEGDRETGQEIKAASPTPATPALPAKKPVKHPSQSK